MKNRKDAFLYWMPRIIAILFTAFLAMMSLDVISPGLSAGQIITGMLMHNIPVFILIAIIIISWKYEIVGGIAFILAGLGYIVMATFSSIEWYLALAWSLQIAGPAFLIGVLFLLNWSKRQKNKSAEQSK